jgi:UDP:flavonoid glycosyltransferase YjiC (YdhE family)
MAKLAFFMLPEAGHLIPALPIATKMMRRGHDITFLTYPFFEREITTRGFRCVALFPRLFPSCKDSDGLFTVISNERRRLTDKVLNSYEGGVSVFRSEIAALNPDIIFIDRCLAYIRPLISDLVQSYIVISTNFGDYLPPLFSRTVSPPIEIVLCPKALDYPHETEPRHRRFYVEPSILTDRAQNPFPWESVNHQKPLVYCSFGSQIINYPSAQQILRDVIKLLAISGQYQVVASVGSSDEVLYIQNQYPSVIALQTVPQLDVLRSATATITHGGLGTIKESIWSGVPMLVIPFVHDQPENARRVSYHRLGMTLEPTKFSATAFLSTFATFQDEIPAFRENLFKMKEVMLALEQESPSVAILESAISEMLAARDGRAAIM